MCPPSPSTPASFGASNVDASTSRSPLRGPVAPLPHAWHFVSVRGSVTMDHGVIDWLELHVTGEYLCVADDPDGRLGFSSEEDMVLFWMVWMGESHGNA